MTSTYKIPFWFWIVSILGLLRNVFGIYQFMGTVGSDVSTFMMNGMTQVQANLYYNLPVWMNTAFAVGVFGGCIGSLLLLVRKKIANSIFWVSLMGYIVLFIGDFTQGVFEVFGMSQVYVLITVLLISGFLVYYSAYSIKKERIK